MVAYNLISAAICAAISIVISVYDTNKNAIEANGETYLPTRFRLLASIGNGFGIGSIILLLQALRIWVG